MEQQSRPVTIRTMIDGKLFNTETNGDIDWIREYLLVLFDEMEIDVSNGDREDVTIEIEF